jgi:hypothetical protein
LSGPGPLFRRSPLVVADARLAGHVLHRGTGAEAEHVNVRGLDVAGRVLAVRCLSTGRPLPRTELEPVDPQGWPALRRLLATRVGG